VESMRSSISNEVISLLCFKCSNLEEFVQVGALEDPPKCTNCDSSLLGVLFFGSRYAQAALRKKMDQKNTAPLNPQEMDVLSKARRSADLVLSYGKQAVVAQCVYGVGPQTAAKVLARMRPKEEEFYSDLMDAKLTFIRTRQYWD
jgi:ATP-dependent Lhr-like helicase